MQSFSRLKLISFLMSSLLVHACDYESEADSAFFNETKARLQAISYLNDKTIAVSDTAYYRGEWDEGRVILIDLESKRRLGVWYSSVSNPQGLVASTDSLAVLSSGNLVLGQSPQGSWSSLSMLQIDESGQFELQQELKLYNSPQGVYLVDSQPIGFAQETLNFDETWVLSSGIDAVLWKVGFTQSLSSADSAIENEQSDDQQRKLLNIKAQRYAPSDTLSLASIVQWNDYSLLIDFNRDRLYFVSSEGKIESCSPELGRFEDVMEGAQMPVLLGDRLWVGFGLSGRLIHLDLAQLRTQLNDPNCQINPVIYNPPLGQVPNDLKVIDDKVYVLHSAESALWTYSVESGERIAQRALLLQSNPWSMALSPNRKQMAISEWLSGSVSLLDLDQDGPISRLDSDLFSPPPPAQCFQALEQNDFSEQDTPINHMGVVLQLPDEAWQNLSESTRQGTPSQDLQGAPQLGLVLSTEAPIKIEVKLEREGEWIELKPLSHRFNVEVNASDLEASSSNNEQQIWKLNQSFIGSASMFKGYAQQGLLSDSLQDDLRSELAIDPCVIFKPKFQALTLDISSLLKQQSDMNNQLYQSSKQSASGKVPLHAIKLSTDSSQAVQGLVAIVYRHWL
ncbi:MAG: hypothetical protein CL916_08105 [Deltaproteobacteria bacterium]|nr:hypothetical protein [Deltaproteobacteria bacterium]